MAVKSTTRNGGTRGRILAAAVAEFAALGHAGARMDRIASAARVSKQLPFHYFGSKERLFRAAILAKLEEHSADVRRWATTGRDTLEKADHVYRTDPQLVRLLLWEALEIGDGPIPDIRDRAEFYGIWIELIRSAQEAGEIDPDLAPQQVVLSFLALGMFPYALPQLTWLVTGTKHEHADFRKARAAHLAALRDALSP